DAAQAHPQCADASDERPRLRKGLRLRPRSGRGLFRSELFPRGDGPRAILPARGARLRTRGSQAPRVLAEAPPNEGGRMSGVQQIEVGSDEGEVRLDRWFKRRFPDLTHGRLEKLLRTGQVRVDGGRAKANQRLQPGQVIRVPPLGPASEGKSASKKV